MIRRLLLASVFAAALSTQIGATEIVANIPLTTPGVFATATLSGVLNNAWVAVNIQSPGTGSLIVDIAESLDGGTTWDEFASFACTGDLYPPNPYGLPVGAPSVCGFGVRIKTNINGAKFRAVIRTITGGTWTVTSVDVTS